MLLHYDCMGIDDWKMKWARRLQAGGMAVQMRPARVKQFELFKQAYGDDLQERRLYSRLHKLSEPQKQLLLQCGLLSVVRLNAGMPRPADA